MSSFFTLSASQKKRKRADTSVTAASNKRQAPLASRPKSNSSRQRTVDEDSVSGSESEDETGPRHSNGEEEEEEGSDIGNETAAERRLRLAEQYLQNVRSEVGFDAAGFDAADLDRDIIAERLKEDVAENKGKVYRWIGSDFDFAAASHSWFRFDCQGVNAVAIQGNFAYTASRDLTLCKWELATPSHIQDKADAECLGENSQRGTNSTQRRRPKQLIYTRGIEKREGDSNYAHHTASIMSMAASEDGKFLATGGSDKRLIIWDAGTLTALKVFTQHRDTVTGLVFRRGTNQLYSCSADRTIKIWSLDELAYIETLFGHQDSVISIAALAAERCVSVGARDRTARLWKIGEESQLVFRGFDPSSSSQKKKRSISDTNGEVVEKVSYAEGSIDSIALVDDSTFITGSDNGSISLWSIHKKKPVFTYPLAHGLEETAGADVDANLEQKSRAKLPPAQPRWVTALVCIPYSDTFLSGSWDGYVRAWRIGKDMRSIAALGPLGSVNTELARNGDSFVNGSSTSLVIRGVINSLSLGERGDRGQDGLCIVVGVGKHSRMGQWKKFRGRNGACVLEVKRKNQEQLIEEGAGSDEGD